MTNRSIKIFISTLTVILIKILLASIRFFFHREFLQRIGTKKLKKKEKIAEITKNLRFLFNGENVGHSRLLGHGNWISFVCFGILKITT